MPEALSVTEVRKRISRIVDEVVDEHRPVVVDRNRRDHFVMLASEDAQLLLEGYGFTPEVLEEPGAVSVWLPELGLYGRGPSFDAAKQDLLDEVRDYVDEYLEEAHAYLRAPNRRRHFPYVVKALLADAEGGLEGLLFPLLQVPADGARPRQATPPPAGVEKKDARLYRALIDVVGLPEAEVRGMSNEEMLSRWMEHVERGG